MRRACGLALIVLLLALPAAVLAAPAARPKALVLGGANNHDWQATTPVIVKLLQQAGWEVAVTETPAQCTLADFKQYAVLVSNYNGPRWGEVAEQALLQYVREGGGFVVIHAANNPFPDWPEYDRLIGGAWREGAGHGERYPFQVRITRPRHPITRGMPAFLHAEDEMYHRLKMQPEAVVLATAYSDPERGGTGNFEPMLWVVNYGKGRVFQTVLGHDVGAMSDLGFAVTLQRGAEWAATGRVTMPMPTAALLATGLASEDDHEQYEAEAGLIAMGPDAVSTLFSCLDMGGRAAEAAAMAVRWIAMRAAGTPQAKVLAKTLSPYLRAGTPAPAQELAMQALGLAGEPGRLAALLADSQLAETALEALAAVPGTSITRAIAASMKGKPAPYRTRALAVLASRADRTALPTAMAAASDADPAVRAAALHALGNLGQMGALPVLVAALGTADTRPTAFAAMLALAAQQMAAGNSRAANQIYQQALAGASTPAQKVAALVGLGSLGPEGVVTRLAQYLDDPDETVAAAAVGAIAQQPGEQAKSLLRTAAGDARPSVAIAALSALGQAGDQGSQEAILAVARKEGITPVRIAAFQALGRVVRAPSEGVVQALLAGLQSEPPVRSAAEDAALDLLERMPQGDRMAMSEYYALLASRAVTNDQRRRALCGLALGARPEHRAIVEPELVSDNAEVRLAAMDAMLRIADALVTAGKGEEAADLYRNLISRLPAGERVTRAAQALGKLGVQVDLPALRGFISKWWVAGPFPNPDNSAYDTAFAPEQGVDLAASYQVDGRTLTWSRHSVSAEGILDLSPIVQPREDAAAYCYAELTSDAEQPATFKLGSDDGAVVWLNGERLFGTPEPRGLTVDQDTFSGKLVAGKNRILVKVLNGAADFQLCLRVLRTDGSVLHPAR